MRRPRPLLIFAITLAGITGNTLISPAIPEILSAFGASDAAAGVLVAAPTLPGIVLAPVIGLLADRFGRRRVLVPCLALFGLAGGAGAFAGSLPMLIGLRFLQGAGSAGLINLAVVVIGDHWAGADRSRMIGYNAGVLTAALAVLPSVGGVLTDLFGWQAPFLVYPGALLVAVAVNRHLSDPDLGKPSLRGQLAGAWAALRTRRMVGLLVVSFATFGLIFGMILTTLPIHLDRVLGIPASQRGLLLGIPALATFSVSVNLGRLVHRIRRAVLLELGAAGFAAGYLILSRADRLWILVAGLLVAGMAEGATIPTIQDAVAATGGPEQRGSLMASFVAAARAGQTTGPIVAGALMGWFGTQTTFALGGAVAAVLAVVGAVVTRPSRSKLAA